jgi:long-chain acyl-CoA synthetase
MIRHALVQGPNQQHLTALLHINPGSIDPAILESSELLRTTLAAEVERLWNNLYPHEPPIKHFDWILDDWTIESGAYTPTLKLKRKALIERYKQQFNSLIHVQ